MNSQRRGRQRTAGFRYMFHLGQFRFTPPKADICSALAHVRFGQKAVPPKAAMEQIPKRITLCVAQNVPTMRWVHRRCRPKVKVEPARLVPRGGTYYEITRRQNRTLSKIYRNSVEFLLLTGPQVKFRTGYGIDPKPQAPADAQNKYGCEEVSSHLGSGGRAVRRRLYPPKADIYDCERHVR